ncbi:Senescence regulator [Quillaja saponaria]|uniref:Senescence regulator n=1 Tax=Quillaja saponaria TaxID=32244 RepID=A0AAD7Q0B6_QUISA|nr:Senescence regulator [Quillaja saponaria]
MASRKSFLSKPNYIYPTTSDTLFSPKPTEGIYEFDESELWNNNSGLTMEAKKILSNPRSGLKRGSRKVDNGGRGNPIGSASLPVNIPDWSKILKEDYEEHIRKDQSEEDDSDYGEENRVPPHEYLARTRGASFSVHEGIGRTLKGRDLRRVRNAIWKKVGFED